MSSRISKPSAVIAALFYLALCVTMGGHWVVLQSIAWAQMWISNTRTETVTQAVVHTLDGKHPCKMCHEISRAKTSEQKTKPVTIAFKTSVFIKSVGFLRLKSTVADRSLHYLIAQEVIDPLFSSQPITPPPQIS